MSDLNQIFPHQGAGSGAHATPSPSGGNIPHHTEHIEHDKNCHGDLNTIITDKVHGEQYSDIDVDSHLNTSTATTGDFLAWNGDYHWTNSISGDLNIDGNLTINDPLTGSTTQQTFYGKLSSTGYPIDTFDTGNKSMQFYVHATDGTITSTTHVSLSVSTSGTEVDGSIFGDTTAPPGNSSIILDMDAVVHENRVRLLMYGLSGDVVVFGTTQFLM